MYWLDLILPFISIQHKRKIIISLVVRKGQTCKQIIRLLSVSVYFWLRHCISVMYRLRRTACCNGSFVNIDGDKIRDAVLFSNIRVMHQIFYQCFH